MNLGSSLSTNPLYKKSFLPPATKLGQGYVFTRVCDSVHRGGGGSLVPGGLVPRGVWSRGECLVPGRGVPGGDPPGWPLLRAVRILLECILVFNNIFTLLSRPGYHLKSDCKPENL